MVASFCLRTPSTISVIDSSKSFAISVLENDVSVIRTYMSMGLPFNRELSILHADFGVTITKTTKFDEGLLCGVLKARLCRLLKIIQHCLDCQVIAEL